MGNMKEHCLSFISDPGKHTVATFIDENKWDEDSLPTMGLDALYDYFIAGTNMIHSSSQNISRLMEIETIIRDAHGLNEMEKKTLKIIGILNLIGRSGYLRASRRIIDYAIGANYSSTLDVLVKKSIITYRNHSDEYRIWHGTDINITVKMDTYRTRYQRTPLSELLKSTIHMEPVVAAKHGIETGTMRLFERRFESTSNHAQDGTYDGVIIYVSDNAKPVSARRSRDYCQGRKHDRSEVCVRRSICNT